jgi:predicted TIM-barrel fold metal-dependent hydrolase
MSEPRLVDVDVVLQRATMPLLVPYLSPGWREHLTTGGSASTFGALTGGYTLPRAPYRPPSPVEDAREPPAHFDAAVVEPGIAAPLSGLANVEMAVEIARAANDWLAQEVVATDERFRGSILVSARDGVAAAEEVERVGDEPRQAQIILASPPCLLGDRSLNPLFAAAEERGLPITLQSGGAYIAENPGPTTTGFPTTWAEYRIDCAYGGIPHLVSLVLEGVFERHPSLRVVFSGFGVAWLPSVIARLEAAFDAGIVDPRKGLSRRPLEVVREHVRFTTRDLDVASTEELLRILPAEDVERLLIYSSAEGGGKALSWDLLGSEASEAIRFANAVEVLRLPELRPAAAG